MKNITQKLIGMLIFVFTTSITINAQEIGELYQDGYIFHISDDETEVLLAALEDLPGMFEWGCYGDWLSSTTGTVIGSGLQNTLNIASSCSEASIAASEALDYESDNFDDWYLPSKIELKEMYNTIGNDGAQGDFGGFGNGNPNYWSSTQQTSNWSWFVDFNNGSMYYGHKYQNYKVRPIRSALYIEVLGCTDETACNYNTEATDSDYSCNYPDEGKNCDGDYVIGTEAFGGVIFHINEAGTGGFVVRTEKIGKTDWGCQGTEILNANNWKLGSGKTNTEAIVENCSSSNIAAFLCDDFIENGFNDWFLPSKEALELIYSSVGPGGTNEITTDPYHHWSSTQYSQNKAYKLGFGGAGGSLANTGNKTGSYRVLPIRSFGGLEEGCMDENACNYDVNAEFDDSSCIYSTDLDACATCSGDQDGSGTIVDNDSDNDGICDENEIVGCMDETALNYNADATDDNGSCEYIMEYTCETEDVFINLPEGWSMLGYTCSVSMTVDQVFQEEELSKIDILKDGYGNAFIYNYEYDGIGALEYGKGYQIKLSEGIENYTICSTLEYTDLGIVDCGMVENIVDLPNGWSMFGYTCPDTINAIDALTEIQDKIVIVKDDWGLSYIPVWGFNALGYFKFGEGYQIKTTEAIEDFEFCPTYIESQ